MWLRIVAVSIALCEIEGEGVCKKGGVNWKDGTYDGVETGCGRTDVTVVYVFRKALVSGWISPPSITRTCSS
jgi:hypothetical protein